MHPNAGAQPERKHIKYSKSEQRSDQELFLIYLSALFMDDDRFGNSFSYGLSVFKLHKEIIQKVDHLKRDEAWKIRKVKQEGKHGINDGYY